MTDNYKAHRAEQGEAEVAEIEKRFRRYLIEAELQSMRRMRIARVLEWLVIGIIVGTVALAIYRGTR